MSVVTAMLYPSSGRIVGLELLALFFILSCQGLKLRQKCSCLFKESRLVSIDEGCILGSSEDLL